MYAILYKSELCIITSLFVVHLRKKLQVVERGTHDDDDEDDDDDQKKVLYIPFTL